MAETDLFELLRRGDPAPVGPEEGPDSPTGRRILATVMANVEPTPGRTIRRRRLIIAALVAALVASAAAWYIASRPVGNPIGIACHETPDPDGSSIVVAPQGPPSPAACVPLWQNGSLPKSGRPVDEVPTLLGCVGEGGTLLVFPSDDTDLCQDLGLAAPLGELDERIVQLGSELTGRINSSDCLTLPDARQLVVEELARLELDDWQIVVADPTPERPCASVGIDGEAATVRLIPVPPAG